MSKDPAFLFYPNDWLGGTMGMTFEEKGAYMDLLMMQFNRGHMTSHMIGQAVGQLWVNIKDKFKEDDNGLYYNARLEDEQTKRKAYSDSRRNNKKGKNQHSLKEKKVGHMTLHMEDVNEDVNKSLIKDVCDFFNVNEIKNFNTYKAIHTFVMVSGIDSKTFEAYKQYKEQSNEITHGWRTFIGDPENKFLDGAWSECDWSAKIKDIPKSKNGIPEEPDQIWIKKNGQNADLWMEACRKWRANGWQYKQQEGATIKTWKQTNK